MKDNLEMNRKNGWEMFDEKARCEVFAFAEDYKAFLGKGKTERFCVFETEKLLKKAGFKPIESFKSIRSGDKVYQIIHNKALIAATAGKELASLRLIGSHMDSPRLDLKPFPLFEDNGLALLKTHYYGGIKKYQWVNCPLVLCGVIHKKDGSVVTLFPDDEDAPCFIIPDLLIHLSAEQMKKEPAKIVEGEDLNAICANFPNANSGHVGDTNEDAGANLGDQKCEQDAQKATKVFRTSVLRHLNVAYGIVEEDLVFAELMFVPAGKPVDIGFDKSMIAAYGQDDKACVYTSLRALIEAKNPQKTICCYFSDKEEIGSVGYTGAESFCLGNFFRTWTKLTKESDEGEMLAHAKAISADVDGAYDPNFKSSFEILNSGVLGCGVVLMKYGGSGGKVGSNDAGAEYLSFIRNCLEDLPWQSAELGRIDAGGGGTIAKFMARYGMECVDVGPAVLGMHSPCEVSSKLDIYAAYLFYKAFLTE